MAWSNRNLFSHALEIWHAKSRVKLVVFPVTASLGENPCPTLHRCVCSSWQPLACLVSSLHPSSALGHHLMTLFPVCVSVLCSSRYDTSYMTWGPPSSSMTPSPCTYNYISKNSIFRWSCICNTNWGTIPPTAPCFLPSRICRDKGEGWGTQGLPKWSWDKEGWPSLWCSQCLCGKRGWCPKQRLACRGSLCCVNVQLPCTGLNTGSSRLGPSSPQLQELQQSRLKWLLFAKSCVTRLWAWGNPRGRHQRVQVGKSNLEHQTPGRKCAGTLSAVCKIYS